LGISSLLADFGLRGAVEKRISEGEAQGAFLSSAVLLKLVPVAVIVLIILALQPQLNSYLGAPFAVFLAVAVVLQEIAQLSVVVLKGELRVGETAVLRLLRHSTWVVLGAILVDRGFGAEGLIYGLLAGLCVVVGLGWYKTSTSPSWPSVPYARSLLSYGKFNAISAGGGYVYSWMDVALIGFFLTQTDVGAYEVAWRVSAVAILFSRAIATSIFPQISEWDAAGATARIEDLIPEMIVPSLILVVPAFFGALVLSTELLAFLFGPEFTIAALALIVLMLDKITEGVQLVLGRALQAVDRPDLAAKATVVAVALNLVLNVVLIQQFGITGAAVATTVASLVGGVLLHGYYLSQMVTVRIPYRDIGGCIFAGGGMALVVFGVSEWIEVSGVVDLVGIVLFGGVVYTALVVLNPRLRAKLTEYSQQITASQ